MEISLRIGREILVFVVDQAIGEQEYLHSYFLGCHIFCGVIAYHQAFFRLAVQSAGDIFIIFEVRLAVAGIFIGGI